MEYVLVPVEPTEKMLERMRDQNMCGSMDNMNAYAAAIAAAPKVESEPVAWEWRFNYSNGGYTRYLCTDKTEAEAYSDSLLMDGIVRPLYLASPAAQIPQEWKDAVKKAIDALEYHTEMTRSITKTIDTLAALRELVKEE